MEHAHRLKVMWIDVCKAFDSVSHTYLMKCIEKLNFPPWIGKFLQKTINNWHLDIFSNGEKVLSKKITRGILQGDSLSPLLFVLCIDPLSRALNSKYPKVNVKTEGEADHAVNHLLFIDDLKLLAHEDSVLKSMAEEVERFFTTVGLKINHDKSATNSEVCTDSAELLNGAKGYKYLGITEDSQGAISGETFKRIRAELLGRVERLCNTKLNAVNLFRAINEHAMSLLNYYVGVL